ncbi:adhesion G-protein coupled receptor G7 isoform X1 [Choloepus didactylus]|uniref:adhesion G-protein coupled receptor G7 isoform X1 n=1 Tax=Choloepus didactylus TaxID=27675 RepID=UPI0018A0F94F|nr:adhesion G-protein coupled receptor G7 isoform X1 [Choloepus didactylus]
MASCRISNVRELVAIVCGLLTAIILGLGIWRTVVRIQREIPTTQTNTLQGFCKNGGTWQNGRCICPEEWKGLRCTITNFCENSTYEGFTFARIPVGRYGPSLQTCEKNTPNAGFPKATRLCNLTMFGEIELQNATMGNCSETLKSLEDQIVDISNKSGNISSAAQILTSDANKLTAENISSATMVVAQIFNSSQNATPEAKEVAVTTVSQLLDASEDVFQRAAAVDKNNIFGMLIQNMENYSLSLDNGSVVVPNIAVQSVKLSPNNTVGFEGIRFSVGKGASDFLTPSSTQIDSNANGLNPEGQTELQILLNISKADTTACGFVMFQNNKLFQSKIFRPRSNFNQRVISGSIETSDSEKRASVEMVFNPKHNQKQFDLHSYACVFWNVTKEDWSTVGCFKERRTDGFLHCHCNHTTNFAVLVSFRKIYKYPASLDVLSTVGCALSIAGLALTIIFQIVTRKVRKTSVTWVLVSLCTSMLIFNLLFVLGIENSNKNLKMSDINTNNTGTDNDEIPTTDIVNTPNPMCTVMAALLHYFLLATFTWTGLSAAQLYFLLIRTMKPLPPHFILFISVIGWGVPAVVVSLTVGILYSQNGSNSQWELDYRQEEICWLAVPESNGFITSPFLWSFIIPVAIILISNVVIFVIITVKVLWKNNQNLTSTKKVSSIKKILSTLSIAVIFGITWILAFLMLVDNDDIRIILSYIFCLFNTTQGLQIFILYTVRTGIFQREASKVMKSLSSSAERVKSVPLFRKPKLRVRMYNMIRSFPTPKEHFRLLEPSVVTEEMTLSESDQANSSI